MRKRGGILGADGTLHGGSFMSSLLPRVIPPKFSWSSKNPTELCLTGLTAVSIFLLPYLIPSFLPLRGFIFGSLVNALLLTGAWRLGVLNSLGIVAFPFFTWCIFDGSSSDSTLPVSLFSLSFWLFILDGIQIAVFSTQKQQAILPRALGITLVSKVIATYIIGSWILGVADSASASPSPSPLQSFLPLSAITQLFTLVFGALIFCQLLRFRVLSKIENFLGLRLRRFGYRNTHIKLFDEIE